MIVACVLDIRVSRRVTHSSASLSARLAPASAILIRCQKLCFCVCVFDCLPFPSMNSGGANNMALFLC